MNHPLRLSREPGELANSVSHGVGLLGAIAVTPVLVVQAAVRGGAADIVGASVFGATLILLYLASTTFHAAEAGAIKERLRTMDHAAIYLLIAGTYTPFTLGVLRGAWGWTLFGMTWGAAVIGVAAKVWGGKGHPRLSASMYLVMGWLVLIAIRPLVIRMDSAGLLWLVAGGVSYSAGTLFYLRSSPRAHLIWHAFVLCGSACHVVAVLLYAR